MWQLWHGHRAPRIWGPCAFVDHIFKTSCAPSECPPCPPRWKHKSSWSCFIVFFAIEREKVFAKWFRWNVRRESEKGPAFGCGTGPAFGCGTGPRVWLIRHWIQVPHPWGDWGQPPKLCFDPSKMVKRIVNNFVFRTYNKVKHWIQEGFL